MVTPRTLVSDAESPQNRDSKLFAAWVSIRNGSSLKRVCAVESDEMSPGNGVAAHQASGPLHEQNHQLLTIGAYRLDEPSTRDKLLYEGWRDPRECCGDEYRLIRSVLWEPFRSIAHNSLNICDAMAGQVGPGGIANIRPAFHAPYKAGQVSTDSSRTSDDPALAHGEDDQSPRAHRLRASP